VIATCVSTLTEIFFTIRIVMKLFKEKPVTGSSSHGVGETNYGKCGDVYEAINSQNLK